MKPLAELQALAAADRVKQGFPPRITDPKIAEKLEAIIWGSLDDPILHEDDVEADRAAGLLPPVDEWARLKRSRNAPPLHVPTVNSIARDVLGVSPTVVWESLNEAYSTTDTRAQCHGITEKGMRCILTATTKFGDMPVCHRHIGMMRRALSVALYDPNSAELVFDLRWRLVDTVEDLATKIPEMRDLVIELARRLGMGDMKEHVLNNWSDDDDD